MMRITGSEKYMLHLLFFNLDFIVLTPTLCLRPYVYELCNDYNQFTDTVVTGFHIVDCAEDQWEYRLPDQALSRGLEANS
jgi:hypothetical protein